MNRSQNYDKTSSSPGLAFLDPSGPLPAANPQLLYRSILENLRKLEEKLRMQSKRSFKNLFTPEVVHIRQKVKDKCEQLLFLDPVNYGEKVADILWRKVFYDVIVQLRKNKRHIKAGSSVECGFRSFFQSALCFFHHLVLRLHSEHLSCPRRRPLHNPTGDWMNVDRLCAAAEIWGSNQPTVTQMDEEFVLSTCHRFLVCLGDIARYMLEIDDSPTYVSMSKRFYHQALKLRPTFAFPLNQLGTLMSGSNFRVDAVYWYMRCVDLSPGLKAAQCNLQRVLEKNRRLHVEMVACARPPDLLSPPDHLAFIVKRFCCQFIHLQGGLFTGGQDLSAVTSICQAILRDFLDVVKFHWCAAAILTNGDFLTDEMLFMLVVMSLMTISSLRKSNSPYACAAIAFLLALFSHILLYSTLRIDHVLHSLLADEKSAAAAARPANEPPSPEQTSGRSSSRPIGQPTPVESKDSPPKKHSFKHMRRRRRPMRHSPDVLSEDEDSQGADGAVSSSDNEFDDGALSDESADSTILASTNQTADQAADNLIGQQLNSADHVQIKTLSVNLLNYVKPQDPNPQKSPEETPLEDTLKEHSGETLRNLDAAGFGGSGQPTEEPGSAYHSVRDLSIRILLHMGDFNVARNVNISDLDLGSSPDEALFSRIASDDSLLEKWMTEMEDLTLLAVIRLIVNWLAANPDIVASCAELSLYRKLCTFLNRLPSKSHIDRWKKLSRENPSDDILGGKIPVTEDNSTRSLSCLQQFYSDFDWSREDISELEQLIIRRETLLKFGRSLSESNGDVNYDEQTGLFTCAQRPQEEDPGIDPGLLTITDQMAETEKQRQKQILMESMGQLRLQNEVERLQQELDRSAAGGGSLSPYLIPEVYCFTDRLDLVRQLVSSGHFIVVVSKTVINSLDLMKKEKPAAREAIKFLESALLTSKCVRAQRDGEIAHFDFGGGITFRRQERKLWSLSELMACAEYFSRQSANHSSGQGMVTMLFQQQPEGTRIQAMLQLAAAAGIAYTTIEAFHATWASGG